MEFSRSLLKRLLAENAPWEFIEATEEKLINKGFSSQMSSQIVGKCLVEAAKNSTHPVPKILVYSVYYGWQHLVMLHKANLCLDVPFSELKNVANSPGMRSRNKGNFSSEAYCNFINYLDCE